MKTVDSSDVNNATNYVIIESKTTSSMRKSTSRLYSESQNGPEPQDVCILGNVPNLCWIWDTGSLGSLQSVAPLILLVMLHYELFDHHSKMFYILARLNTTATVSLKIMKEVEHRRILASRLNVSHLRLSCLYGSIWKAVVNKEFPITTFFQRAE